MARSAKQKGTAGATVGAEASADGSRGQVTADDLYEAQRWAIDVLTWNSAIANLGAALRCFHEPEKTKRPSWLQPSDIPPMIAARWQDIKAFPDDLHRRQQRYFAPHIEHAIRRGNLGIYETSVSALGENLPTAHHVAVRALGVGVALLYGLLEIWEQQHPGQDTEEDNCIGLWPNELMAEQNRAVVLKFAHDIPPLRYRELAERIRKESHHAAEWLKTQMAAADAPGDDVQRAIGSSGPPTANARILDTLTKVPGSRDWSAAQFAEHLGLSKGTIGKTPAWKTLMAARDLEKRDRMDRNQAV